MPISSLDQKDRLVKSVVAKAAKRKAALKVFTQAFYKDAAPTDVASESADILLDIASDAFDAAGSRPLGQAAIHVANPPADGPGGSVTRIILVNDNMPFLVDTVTTALTDLGIEIQRIFHPIIPVKRTAQGKRSDAKGAQELRESVICLDVDRRGPNTRARIEDALASVLADNRIAVADWRAMLKQLSACAVDLKYGDLPLSKDDVEENIAFLEWLADENFTLLGYRYYPIDGLTYEGKAAPKDHPALGVLRDHDNKVWRGHDGMGDASAELREFLQGKEPILITKANARATVHRSVHMDYIGIKHFDDSGVLVGEHRFVGLFTSTAYARQARSIPILRKKIETVREKAGYEANSHAGKALLHTLETFPRDELFQIETHLLLEIALGVLSLNERPRPRLFVRPDRFERFVSVLAYIPRETYAGALRQKLGAMLSDAFNGSVSVYYVQLGDAALTRVQFIVRTEPGSVPDYDEEALNSALEAMVKGWSARFLDALTDSFGDEEGRRLFYNVRDGFNMAYREAFTPEEAVRDILALQALAADDSQDRSFRLYRRQGVMGHQAHLKIYRQDQILALSDSLPSIENLGLRVIDEVAFSVATGRDGQGWVHDFLVEDPHGDHIDTDAIGQHVADILSAIAASRSDDDGYNALVLKSGLTPPQINIMRALGHYAQQIGIPFTRSYVGRCLVQNQAVTQRLSALFTARFDHSADGVARGRDIARLGQEIDAALDDVKSQDDDRILRLFQSVIMAILRTNAFCNAPEGPAPDTLAFKIRSADVAEMPDPKPHVEIFVFGPQVEGVHLRGGPVARGGLRWTDRPEDYRTEILGLLKAQIVKNSVIVPVGAKGGFLPRQLPEDGDRDAIFEAGRAAYKVFIRHLIALTDNLVDGEVVPPEGIIRHDEDDPYLVVAADKGTATFSDTANAIALDMGFWLGDAFASGGSNGYDHKKMGITARGGWVSVQRHFREMGLNTQEHPFSVVGVGDMSGDVFGNGMLLSETICLVGAFDHRNIFVDPDPDPAASFAERKRLFELPRSSWKDYDESLLSKGGRIYDRSDKKLKLTPQIKNRFDIEADSVSPQELMKAILLAQADLLWFGGIGTYVKAKAERNGDVGDRANDAIRVDAGALRVKVVGEGANLGITQAARLEFARAGGRINADFIDNSAGVDCSDNEVNLKIMLESVVKSGKLSQTKRDKLLETLTDDVAELVLRDNYLQTQAISMAEAQAAKTLDRHAALIRRLEREGRVTRALDGLPSEDVIAEMAQKDVGLSRPELASLMCHAKIAVFDALMASDVVDDPALEEELLAAFPQRLHKTYAPYILSHQLRREIIATKLSNAVINRGGLSLIFELDDAINCGLARAVATFVVVRKAFDLRSIWRGIDAGDYSVPANIQTLMHAEVAFSLRRQMMRMLQNAERDDGTKWTISAALERYSDGIRALLSAPQAPLIGLTLDSFLERRDMYIEQSVDADVATAISALDAYSPALIIVNAAREIKADVTQTAKAYFLLAKEVGADWLRQQLSDIVVSDGWDRRAITEMEADLAQQQMRLVARVLMGPGKAAPSARVETWLAANAPTIKHAQNLMQELQQAGAPSVSRLSYAVRYMRARLMPLT
jgi:glutamate dehydrogenase